jgi:hypothetical protein
VDAYLGKHPVIPHYVGWIHPPHYKSTFSAGSMLLVHRSCLGFHLIHQKKRTLPRNSGLVLYRGADKSIAQPGRKQTTAIKL